MTILMPAVLWMVGGIVAWLAGRYHLDVNQQNLVTTDIVGGITFVGTMAGGLVLHLRARMAPPPTGGTNAPNPNVPLNGR